MYAAEAGVNLEYQEYTSQQIRFFVSFSDQLLALGKGCLKQRTGFQRLTPPMQAVLFCERSYAIYISGIGWDKVGFQQ
jgi:hypothetical protein